MHIYTYTYIYIYTHIYTHTYTYIYIYIYAPAGSCHSHLEKKLVILVEFLVDSTQVRRRRPVPLLRRCHPYRSVHLRGRGLRDCVPGVVVRDDCVLICWHQNKTNSIPDTRDVIV